MNSRISLPLLFAATFALSACVSQQTYNQEVAKANTYQQLDNQLKGEVAADQAQIQQLQGLVRVTLANGIAWMEWSPRGEGIDGPKNRPDFGMLMLRIMANNPSWTQSPNKVTKPGMEEAVMGPYLPKGEYTTRAAFEAGGLKK